MKAGTRVVGSIAVSLCVGIASAGIALPAFAGKTSASAKVETVKALRSGGYVIVMRHGSTEFGEVDTHPLQFDNASAQRTLSDLGRLEARGIGKAMRTIGVPIGLVYSSPLRRATETAEYLGFESVVRWRDLAEDSWAAPPEAVQHAATLRTLVATAPVRGTNVLVLTHKPIITRALGEHLASIEHLEMVVVQPRPDGGVLIVDRLRKEEWRATLRAMKLRLEAGE